MKKFLLMLLAPLLLLFLSIICFEDKLEPIKNYLISATSSKLEKNQINGIDVNVVGDGYKTQLATRLSGVVVSKEEKERALALAKDVDAVYFVEDNITVEKPKIVEKKIVFEPVQIEKPVVVTCQEKLDKLLSSSKIHFETSSSDIKEDSFKLLDDIASVLKECESSIKKVIIEGYTDSSGNEKSNLMLSQDRADAVKMYLITKQGIDPNQLESKGFGAANPIADNETEEGKSKNRRIEFKLDGGVI